MEISPKELQDIIDQAVAKALGDFTMRQAIRSMENVPESKAEDIVKPLSVLDQMSDDEILYWSTPYYDELQAKKERKE